MSRGQITLRLLLLAFVATLVRAETAKPASSIWAHLEGDGKLAYQNLPHGNRIMDFSFAGYMGGGHALPDVPVKKTLHPSGGDDTAAIQAALDEVAALEPSGFRGAVLLERGEFHCSGTLALRASGVVLRGSGAGKDGTVIKMTGKPHAAFSVGSSERSGARASGTPVAIADDYVPAGARSFTVRDVSGFTVGETVLVQHPVTAEWVKFMGMDTMVRDGKKETWLAVGHTIDTERVIAAIEKSTITLDVPLSDALDAQTFGASANVVKCTPPSRLTQIGIESLRVVAPPQPVTINDPHHTAVHVGAVEDAWLRDVAIVDTVNSIMLSATSRRVTLERVAIEHTVATKGAAKPADFAISGSQILLHRCTDEGDAVFFLATMGGASGPNVALDCTFRGDGWIQPHMRWATGLLIDQCRVPEGGIDFMNRGEMGSGHGWAIGWAVAWNCTAKEFLIQRPPGAANWAVGCTGEQRTDVMPFRHAEKLPQGIVDCVGAPVAPASLYLAQLNERLGPAAVKNLGY